MLLPAPRSVKLRKLATAVFTATVAVWALARIAVSRLSPVILMLPKAVPPEPAGPQGGAKGGANSDRRLPCRCHGLVRVDGRECSRPGVNLCRLYHRLHPALFLWLHPPSELGHRGDRGGRRGRSPELRPSTATASRGLAPSESTAATRTSRTCSMVHPSPENTRSPFRRRQDSATAPARQQTPGSD